MTREEFISRHTQTCQAGQIKAYDGRKKLRSPEYSRRKCAKKLWKKYIEREGNIPGMPLFRRRLNRDGCVPLD